MGWAGLGGTSGTRRLPAGIYSSANACGMFLDEGIDVCAGLCAVCIVCGTSLSGIGIDREKKKRPEAGGPGW